MGNELTVAIIGAGTAGRAFALSCAASGFRVVLEDVMDARLRHAEADFASLGHEVTLVSTVEDAVRDADLAVDFVPDELESKLEIWSMIDRMAPPKTVMCTPSEGLSITDLASCTYRGDRCVMVRGLLPSLHRHPERSAAESKDPEPSPLVPTLTSFAREGRTELSPLPGLASTYPPLTLLTARSTAESTLNLAIRFFESLGARTTTRHDPDLPMLLKNMNASQSLLSIFFAVWELPSRSSSAHGAAHGTTCV